MRLYRYAIVTEGTRYCTHHCCQREMNLILQHTNLLQGRQAHQIVYVLSVLGSYHSGYGKLHALRVAKEARLEKAD